MERPTKKDKSDKKETGEKAVEKGERSGDKTGEKDEKKNDPKGNVRIHTSPDQIQIFHQNQVTSLFDKQGLHITKDHVLDIGDAIQIGSSYDHNFISYQHLSFLQNNNNLSLFLDKYGNVGIGTDRPKVELDVEGTVMCNKLLVNHVNIEDLVYQVQQLQLQIDQLKQQKQQTQQTQLKKK